MLAMVVVVFTIVALALLAPDQYVERFSTIFRANDLENDVHGAAYSAQGRIKGLLIGLEILLKRPLTGVGMACFGTYNYENYGTWLQAHNLIGQLTGELGLLGVFAFGYLIYLMFSNIKRIRKYLSRKHEENSLNYNIATACMIALCMLFFLGLFGHNLYRFNWYLIASYIAIIAKLEFRSESQHNIKPTEIAESTAQSSDSY
jgi:O-antigen ligase